MASKKDLVRNAIEAAIVDVLWDDNSPTLKLLTKALNAVPDLIDPEEFRVKLEEMKRREWWPEREDSKWKAHNSALQAIIQELKGDKDGHT